MTKVSDITQISLGVNFRSRLKPSAGDGVGVIQMKDINDSYTIDFDRLTKVDKDFLQLPHFVAPGDLVFRSRGSSMTAVLCPQDCREAVVSSPLLRIRPNADCVDSLYLQWYINHPRTQKYLQSRSDGGMMRFLNKRALGDLPVLLPPLERQRQIGRYYALSLQERDLRQILLYKQFALNNERLMWLAEQDERN